jgi:AraC-like DNA-binding protein
VEAGALIQATYAGAFFALALSLARLARRGADRGRARETVLLAVVAVLLAELAAFFDQQFEGRPHLALTHVPLLLLAAPLLYGSVRDAVSEEPYQLSRLHFAPPALATLALSPFFLVSGETKAALLTAGFPRESGAWTFWTVRALLPAATLSFAAYAGAALFHLRFLWRRDTLARRRQFRPLAVFAGLALTAALTIVIGQWGAAHLKLLGAAAFTGALLYLFVALQRSPELLLRLRREARYARSRLGGLDPDRAATRLEALLQERELFLDEELTLADLAIECGLSPAQLSELVNSRYGVNFQRFINRRRVDHARKLLMCTPEQTALTIAYESGFRSKSAFYSAFVREVGETPQQFRRRHVSGRAHSGQC